MSASKKFLFLALFLALALSASITSAPPAHADGPTIPAGAHIDSATLYLQATTTDVVTVRAHRITTSWDESNVTWNSFTNYSTITGYDSGIVDSASTATGPHTFNVTALVQGWVNSTYPNYGILLEQDLTGYTTYPSSENAVVSDRPWLEICYSVNGVPVPCVDIQEGVNGTVPDSFIYPLYPDTWFGNWTILYTGKVNGYPKEALLRFDFTLGPPPPPPPSCTLTPGYWKTHSSHGPAPYDDTWLTVGENTPFFNSGQTYYSALWVEPKGGNAYWILAHAYIAAQLNGAASDPSVSATFSHATTLLSDSTPTSTLTSAQRTDFINTAGILDNYNNGRISSAHCS